MPFRKIELNPHSGGYNAACCDEELMHKIKGGDMQAFDFSCQAMGTPFVLTSFTKIIGDAETSKDIRQEVLLRVYQSAKRYRAKQPFQTVALSDR